MPDTLDPQKDATRSLLRSFLGVRLFWKILAANAAILVVGVVAGARLGAEFIRSGEPGLAGVVPLAGALLVASVAVNALILWVALRPLQSLRETAEQVAAGHLDVRASHSALADPDVAALTGTLNHTLDRLAAQRERLREIAARALESAEEERKRIAQELHDDTAQSLASILIRLRSLRTESDPEARDARLIEVRGEISEAIEGVRRFARGLRPPALDMLGLAPAVASHARGVAEVSGIDLQIRHDPLDGALSAEAELALYRIVQEALSNAVRHSGARRVELSLERGESAVTAAIEDDGSGFSVEAVRAGTERGLGLFGMEERAAYVGGTVRIDSTPGRGTRVLATIPLEETSDTNV